MNKNDKRYIQTEELILNVFAKLIYENGFDKVTVKDITKSAGISRGAFYIHYQDKYELLSYCENRIMKQLRYLFSDAISRSCGCNEEDLKKFFIKIIYYYKENYLIVSSLLSENRNSELEIWIRENVGNNVLKFYYNITGKDKPSISVEYLSSYLYYAHLGIISEWFHNGMVEAPGEIADIISNLFFKGVLSL
jgi:AcrR family transcriptional regulator